MLRTPWGLGADNFPLVADRYGYRKGKEAHTLWLTVGAEFGFPGLAALILFFASCVVKLWPYTYESNTQVDAWTRCLARMVTAAIIGFAISAQFVSVKYLEHPYYVVLIGAAALKLSTITGRDGATEHGDTVRPAAQSA
jgi:hypothetical protein